MSTAIGWTDETWNPTTGCTEVSPGCDHCYAHDLAHGRLKEVYSRRLPVLRGEDGNPFAVRLWPERLDKPRQWRGRPRMIFVNSMSDLFHADIPYEYVARVFDVMVAEDRHTYQVLTKRPGRAARFWANYGGDHDVPAHIWMGTSIENQDYAYRAKQLLQIPASVRFLSCEPLLGPIDLEQVVDTRDAPGCLNLLTGDWWPAVGDMEEEFRRREDGPAINWVIVGGESGPLYRAMNLDHARAIRFQCVAAGVAFFFKQVGGRTPKAGGCELDGREWQEFPV